MFTMLGATAPAYFVAGCCGRRSRPQQMRYGRILSSRRARASQSPARDSSAGNKTRKKYPACLQMLDPELRMSDLLIGWFCAG